MFSAYRQINCSIAHGRAIQYWIVVASDIDLLAMACGAPVSALIDTSTSPSVNYGGGECH
jgi:hypothetical protein